MFNCVNRFPVSRTGQPEPAVPTRNTSPAQLVACGSCAIKTRAADCFSMTRLKRNHELKGTLRTTRSGMPLRSTAISPKPPLCNKMSATLNACSNGGSLRSEAEPRTQGNLAHHPFGNAAEVHGNQPEAAALQ